MTSTIQGVRGAVLSGAEWGLQRAVTIGYGVLYDYIFERFAPYRALSRQVLALVEAAAPAGVPRRDVRVLDLACGPGNLTFLLGEAGFSVLGVDPYAPLVELAREKRRAKHLTSVAFQQGDPAAGTLRWEEGFDVVVNVHALYAHPEPATVLAHAFRALRPGGHAIIVNFTRRVPLRESFQTVRRREGLGQALRALRWVLPNAVFERVRRRTGPHYWQEEEFAHRLHAAGFTVLDLRRTFFESASLLAWARKDPGPKGG